VLAVVAVVGAGGRHGDADVGVGRRPGRVAERHLRLVARLAGLFGPGLLGLGLFGLAGLFGLGVLGLGLLGLGLFGLARRRAAGTEGGLARGVPVQENDCPWYREGGMMSPPCSL
jgi:hypothetical protein